MISPELLRRYPFFSDLNEHELKGLAMLANEKECAKGDTIFREGDPARRCYLILEGGVEILVNADSAGNRQTSVTSLGPGDLFGWSSLIEPHLMTAGAQVTSRAKIVEFDGPALRAMCEVDCHFGFKLMSKVANVIGARLRDTRVQLMSLAPQP